MRNKLFYYLCWLTAVTSSLQAQAQNKVAAPMKDVKQVIDNTLDSLNKARTARPIAGSSRKGDNPVLFLVGNSTMRTGTLGNGNNGQWGWGFYAGDYFDPDKITVENHALGGTSSRTFYNRLWPDVIKGVRPGDWVIIELGHNDNGPYDSGRARASIPGVGTDSLNVTIKETGVKETVCTYGEYMRRFIRDVKAKGGHPILFSLTPRYAYEDKDSTIIKRVNKTFGLWAKQIAEEQNVPFIDLNDISARKFEKFGKNKVKYMFYIDRIHTSAFGAKVNAESAADGIRAYEGLELANYLKPVSQDTKTGSSRKKGRPVLFTIGDSTVKNKDNDKNGMWGWGSVIADEFNLDKISVENCAMAGRKVFLMEKTGKYQVVYTFGWYLRKFIMDAQEKGAIPIVLSHTPRNKWKDGKIERNTDSFGKWTREAAEATGAYFIDLNKISADKLEKKGIEKTAAYYNHDHTHTSLKGAHMNAESIAEGLKMVNCPLKDYLKK